MTDLSQHIKTLLSSFDCVIIPGLGAFVAEYQTGKIGKKSIPTKDLLFNSQLTRNDGLLINTIVEATAKTYEEVKKDIEAYVQSTKESLKRGEKIVLLDIGTFTQDEAGFIQFNADNGLNTWINSYGLNPVKLKKIQKQQAQKSSSNNNSKVGKTTGIIAGAAALIALIVVFATPVSKHSLINYAGIGYSEPQIQEATAPTEEQALEEAIPEVAKPEKSTETPVEESPTEIAEEPITEEEATTEAIEETVFAEVPEEAKPVEKTLIEEQITPKATVSKNVIDVTKENSFDSYHIIIASLKSMEEAQKYKAKFQAKLAYQGIQIIQEEDLYRISVANFDEQDEAYAFIRSFHLVNPTLRDSWILGLQ